MTWSEAVAGPLAGATCLWQDLDGLHVAPPPDMPPRTSIMWGWRPDSLLVRLRLDANVAYVAVHKQDRSGVPTVPWSTGPNEDGRIAARRLAGPTDHGVGTAYEQVVVRGPGDATGAITFVRPRPDQARGQHG